MPIWALGLGGLWALFCFAVPILHAALKIAPPPGCSKCCRNLTDPVAGLFDDAEVARRARREVDGMLRSISIALGLGVAPDPEPDPDLETTEVERATQRAEEAEAAAETANAELADVKVALAAEEAANLFSTLRGSPSCTGGCLH